MLGDPNKIKFTTVTAKTRGALLDSGELDMVIATFTITDQRKLILDFSPPYYTDGIALLVQKSSGIKGLKDLNNKTIGVAKGADTATRLTAKASDVNVLLSFAAFETYGEILAALQAGRVQAFSTDDTILGGIEAEDPYLKLVGDPFSFEPHGLAFPLDDPYSTKDTEFISFANGVLLGLESHASGYCPESRLSSDATCWAALYRTWVTVTVQLPRTTSQVPTPLFAG